MLDRPSVPQQMISKIAGVFRPKPRLPIDPQTRDWFHSNFDWLRAEFDAERTERAVITPDDARWPSSYRGREEEVRGVADIVADVVGVDMSLVDLVFFDDGQSERGEGHFSSAAGTYECVNDRFLVSVNSRIAGDAVSVVATLAHELTHVRLLGEGRVSPEERDHEPLTDLAVTYFGLGVFVANATLRESNWTDGNMSGWSVGRQGYLTMPDHGYALAVKAAANGDWSPQWASFLRPDVRVPFRQGLRYIRENPWVPPPEDDDET